MIVVVTMMTPVDTAWWPTYIFLMIFSVLSSFSLETKTVSLPKRCPISPWLYWTLDGILTVLFPSVWKCVHDTGRKRASFETQHFFQQYWKCRAQEEPKKWIPFPWFDYQWSCVLSRPSGPLMFMSFHQDHIGCFRKNVWNRIPNGYRGRGSTGGVINSARVTQRPTSFDKESDEQPELEYLTILDGNYHRYSTPLKKGSNAERNWTNGIWNYTIFIQ